MTSKNISLKALQNCVDTKLSHNWTDTGEIGLSPCYGLGKKHLGIHSFIVTIGISFLKIA